MLSIRYGWAMPNPNDIPKRTKRRGAVKLIETLAYARAVAVIDRNQLSFMDWLDSVADVDIRDWRITNQKDVTKSWIWEPGPFATDYVPAREVV